MRKVVTAMIILVSVVAVGLVSLLVYGVVTGGNVFDGGAFMEPELVNRQVFSAKDFNSLVVNYKSESILLIPSSGDEVVLEEYMSRQDPKMLAIISQDGKALDIRSGERPLFIGFLGWRARIKLYIPAEWAADIDLSTSSGGVKSDSAFQVNRFFAHATSGSVRVDNITAAKGITLSSSSGGVSANLLKAGDTVELKSTSGSARAESIVSSKDIVLTSSSGGVSAKNLKAGGGIDLKSTSGSVRVEEAVAQGDVNAKSSSGGVSVDVAEGIKVNLAATSGSVKAGRITGEFALESSSGGVHLDGGAGHGSASSNSGTVRLALDEVTGDINAVSTSGGVTLEIPESTAFNITANTNSGGIKLPEGGNISTSDKKKAEGSFGQNPKININLKASSGSVKVQWH